jgi:hypothetical protein
MERSLLRSKDLITLLDLFSRCCDLWLGNAPWYLGGSLSYLSGSQFVWVVSLRDLYFGNWSPP